EWLRTRALDEWRGAADAEDPSSRAGYLYLKRSPGWQDELGALRRGAAGRRAAEAGRRRAAEMAALHKRLTETEERLAAARGEAEELRAVLEQASRDAAARWQRRAERAERKAAQAADAVALGEADAESVRADLEEARGENRALLRRIRLERSRRAELEAALAGRAAGSPLLTGMRLARQVDGLARVLASTAAADEGRSEETAPAGLGLPAGTRPDAAAAVDALLGRSEPWHLVVDGYNAAFRLDGDDPGELRRRLTAGLGRLARRGGRHLTVTVVWDATGGESKSERVDGVRVLWVADVIADDAIADLAAAATLPMVVATDDRELRERADERGAVTIWAGALIDWLQRR
ncbi:MAG: NYN domain-containing protein, partial [Acidimicrobiia bacterium]